jgi:ATP-dependent helicase/nuclease subunit A
MSLVDLEQRERAIRELATSLALSAGAGSGKTSVLSSRIAEHLARGTAPSRIAAITFTEKAAGELESRVRDTLEKRLVRASSAEERGSLEAALDRFHELTISTIHGFCRELLTYEPLDARWAPGTDIAPEDRSGLGHGLSQWRAALAEAMPRTLELYDVLLSRGALLGAIDDLLENRDLAPHVATEGLDWDRAHAELRDVLAGIEEARKLCSNPTKDKLIENSSPFVEMLRGWLARPGDGTFAALISGETAGQRGGKAGDWAPEGRELYKQALDQIEVWRITQLTRAHRDLVLSLEEHVLSTILEARRQAAVATFDDLLFRAATLLSNVTVRTRLAARWDALLVDEVQDTDPIQAEVAVLLARAASHEGHWTAIGPRPGALFAVGDPKQSIYRFRRADVQVWRDLEDVIRKQGERGALVQNFRSVPGIVAWVNHTFAAMPGYEAQVASRSPLTSGLGALDPVTIVDATLEADEGVPIEREVQAMVHHLSDCMARGATVVDRESGQERPLAWRDVMVLVPRWSHGQDIAEELERLGIECAVEGGGGFFADPSVQACLAGLRAVDEPADLESMVACLRTLFGLTLEDLAKHKAAEGSFRWTVREQPAGPVADALAMIREVASLRSRAGVGRSWTSVLDALLDATRAPAVWSLLPDGPSRLANLDKVRALLRKLEGEQRRASEVMERLRELEAKGAEQELMRMDGDADAVRVTSIFKAKGLESPVIVLLDSQRDLKAPTFVTERTDPSRLPTDRPVTKSDAGRLHLKIGGSFEPPDWSTTVEQEKDALRAERTRWMYVACTRARDHLVLITHPKAQLLHDYVARGLMPASDAPVTHDTSIELSPGAAIGVRMCDALPQVEGKGEIFPGRETEVAALLATPKGAGDTEGESRDRALREARGASARGCAGWRSVGEIVSGRRGAKDDGSGTGVGAAGGNVVHRAMERLELALPTDALVAQAPELVRALADEAGLSGELTERCVTITLRLLAHPILDEVRRAPEHWKETPFAYRANTRIVAGVIDLCFPEDASRERWVVVDWKSDTPPEGHPLRAAYMEQLAIYAKALISTVVPCREVRTVLAGPFPELTPPGDAKKNALETALGAAGDEARPLLEQLVLAGAEIPAVGADVGEPVIATLELVWESAKVALALDLAPADEDALTAQGWKLASAARGRRRLDRARGCSLVRAARSERRRGRRR